jgi:hypothetical protein
MLVRNIIKLFIIIFISINYYLNIKKDLKKNCFFFLSFERHFDYFFFIDLN